MNPRHLVRAVEAADRPAWQALYKGYAQFYGTTLSAATADTVWAWLFDSAHPMEAYLCMDSDAAVGLMHLRACPHPLSGREIGFVDDLYVETGARGSGAADALARAAKGVADARGWPRLRWITQSYNEAGRQFYDRYTGGPSDFILYDWPLAR